MIAGISRDKVYYRCPNAYLKKNPECLHSRLAESIKHRSIAGLREAVYDLFIFFLNQERSAAGQNFFLRMQI